MNSEFQSTLKLQIRWLIILFQIGLFISGFTAFFIPGGVEWISAVAVYLKFPLERWLMYVHNGVQDVAVNQPFIFYGTDWMAFAHILFTILFIGVVRNPVRNK